MRRDLSHICAALLAFLIGFLVSGSGGSFVAALLLGGFFFTLVKTLISPNPDLHYVKVTVLTLLIWIPFAAFVVNFAFPYPMTCDMSWSGVSNTGGAAQQQAVRFDQPVNEVTEPDRPDCSCGSQKVNPALYSSVWAGVVNGKAISLPAVLYPPRLKSAGVRGVVAVSVLIDESGGVVWAESVSGHPLLRPAAREAACRARFNPTMADGPPLRVSGVLIYRFGL